MGEKGQDQRCEQKSQRHPAQPRPFKPFERGVIAGQVGQDLADNAKTQRCTYRQFHGICVRIDSVRIHGVP